MALFHNLDRIDAELNTKHPFLWTCPLELGGDFPVRELISLRVHVTETMRPPLRIARFATDDAGMTWYLQDAGGSDSLQVGFSLEDADQTTMYPIKDMDGCLSGHLVCTPVLVQSVHALVRNAGGRVITNNNDFILDASCHIPVLSGVFKVISINGINHTTDITVNTDTNVILKKSNDAYFSVSALSDYKDFNSNTDFTELQINGVTVSKPGAGWRLILTHALASNLRVLTNSDGLHLVGVQDV